MKTNGSIRLKSINIKGKRIDFIHDISDELKRYFLCNLFCQYSIDIEIVPCSIACIPFVANVLPIIWLTDSTLYVEELDKSFYECLNEVREGYKEMYPMLKFSGKVITEKIVDNTKDSHVKNHSVQLFSGGVDAYTTFFRHLDEKPDLITVWGGGDVNVNDKKGWYSVSTHTKDVAKYNNVNCYFIRSNFVEFLNIGNLNKLVSLSGDRWWHGFQHALALLGLSAPISMNYKNLYIASSYPAYMKGQYTLASDPTIDNNVKIANVRVTHDGYELDRQDKVRYLVNKHKEGYIIQPRVCWESDGGSNCCRCEKCYRTILEIVSEGGNPNKMGFTWTTTDIGRCKNDMKYKIQTSQDNVLFLRSITEHLEKQKKIGFIGNEYDWFINIDFDRFNDNMIKQIYNCWLVRKVRHLPNRIMKVIKRKKNK